MNNSKYDDNENHSNYLSMTNCNNKKSNFYSSSIQKNKEKRNSNFSPINKKNYFEINNDILEMKRYGAHYNKNKNKNKNQENSYYSINPSGFKGRNSYKDLEQNIMNKILDISMRIEKEENIISSTNNNENNLNLSTLVKSRIDGESDSIYHSKNKTNNKLKLKNKSNLNLKLNMSNSSPNNSRVSNNDISKNNFISKTPVLKAHDKYRVLYQKKIVYDSFDSEEEKRNEDDRFYISPKSNFSLVFDFLIIIFSLFDIVYSPLRLSKIDGFCDLPNNFIIYIYYCIDFLYIIDLLLGFFRSYYNFEFVIINNKTRIFHHYIVTQFWLDFIEAIPVFSYIVYLCKKRNNIYCTGYDLSNREMILLLFCFVKQMKLFKIINIKNNCIMFIIKDIISENEIIEQIVILFITTGICVFCFYSFISLHIFIGRHSYPNWIIKAGFQNQSHRMLYLISFYYLLTTMTTVGYGDIVGVSLSEIIFQIIVLSVGITIYSWIVSNIGNYVKNESYASMQFNKDKTILEEIRISHPNMSFKLYKHIYQHLHARKIRQKLYDSNLLINSLPYSLKNTVLLTIYKETINNLKIFRKCQNSDFIVRLLTNFIPIFSKKNAILIHEGQSVENIIFIKKGVLTFQAAIDKEYPEDSIKYYLFKIFADNNNNNSFNLSNYDESSFSQNSSSNKSKDLQTHINRVKTTLYTVINKKAKNSIVSEINESGIGKEMGKWDYGGEDFYKNKYHFLNIISISKNESCGVVYMVLDKPCPLSLKVKSKIAELLLLRKADACDISLRYPNIWMKYLKKNYYNMFSVNNIAIKKLKHFWENREKNLNKQKKPLKRCKSNLNLCCIYKINDLEVNEISKILNDKDNTKKRIQRAKTLGRIKGNFNGNINKIFRSNNNKKSNNATINYSDNNLKSLNSKLKSEQKSKVSNENKIRNRTSKNKESKLKFTSKSSQNHISSENLKKKTTEIKSNNSKNTRRNYISKLKIEIKKLKNSNKYYKTLLKEVCTSKGIDEKLLLVKLQNNNVIKNEINEKENNLRINFGQNLNQNIVNNITINNNIDNKSSLFKKSLNLNELEYESTISESPRKFDTTEIKIKSEIKLFYRAKYKNLDKFTFGEYSKNEKLQKQCLNYLQLYIETDKKKISKKANQKINKERRKNSYNRNYDFREILNKFNLRNQRKKENLMNKQFMNNNSNENKIQDMFEKFKNNYFKKRKNKTKKFNLSQTPVNREEKSRYSTKDNTIKNNRKKKVYQSRGNNEYEKEILFNKSENHKSKLNSINTIEKNRNSNIDSPKNIISGKNMNSFRIIKLESCNVFSSQNDK